VSISRVREQPTGKSRGMHIYISLGRKLGVRHVGPENYLVILFIHIILVIIFTNDMSFGLVGIG
jgi:hypothetical protein